MPFFVLLALRLKPPKPFLGLMPKPLPALLTVFQFSPLDPKFGRGTAAPLVPPKSLVRLGEELDLPRGEACGDGILWLRLAAPLELLRSSKDCKALGSSKPRSPNDFAVQSEGSTRLSSRPAETDLPGARCILTTLSTARGSAPSIWDCVLRSPGTTMGCATLATTSWCASSISSASRIVSVASSTMLSKRPKLARPKAPASSKKFVASRRFVPPQRVNFIVEPAGA
mmetsp:Transcript_4707/g.14215  ORF Transcript_4707/g.14215 Transcript_4707/m.14215 type:complete len:227 (+) Transcript_4707:117-797(+)